jgi:hypothetical protein
VLACGHDSGYAPFLGQFVGDKQLAERITLLEGSPFPAAISGLGLKSTQFNSVFNAVPPPPPVSAGLVGPTRGRGVASTVAGTLTDRGSNAGRPMGFRNPQARSDRLGPVLTDQAGHRVDRPLRVNEAVVENLKKGSLCYHYFLRGDCVLPTCRQNHVHPPLTDEEFDALWSLARQGRCFKSRKADRDPGDDCSDAKCVYSHRSGDMYMLVCDLIRRKGDEG